MFVICLIINHSAGWTLAHIHGILQVIEIQYKAFAITMHSIKATFHKVASCSVNCMFGNNLGDWPIHTDSIILTLYVSNRWIEWKSGGIVQNVYMENELNGWKNFLHGKGIKRVMCLLIIEENIGVTLSWHLWWENFLIGVILNEFYCLRSGHNRSSLRSSSFAYSNPLTYSLVSLMNYQ